VTATYSIVPPGGAWDVADNGVYTISVEGSQVLDGGGNAVAAGVLGYVMVGINGSGSGGAITITPGTGGNVTVGFNFPNPPSIPLTTTVDFGDGTTGAPGPHTYNQPGTYTVTITVTGGATPLTFTTTVTVNSTGGGNFRVRVSKIKLDDSGTDTITLTGVISVPSNIDYTGKTIDVNVGGATQTFTLDAKGSAKSANGKIKVAFPSNKKKKGTGDLQQVLVKTQFSGAFANAIKANTPKDAAGFPTVLPVRVLFNGQTYTQTLNVEFKTNTKGSGTRFGFF
jgi:PKD repeat protein